MRQGGKYAVVNAAEGEKDGDKREKEQWEAGQEGRKRTEVDDEATGALVAHGKGGRCGVRTPMAEVRTAQPISPWLWRRE